MDECVAIRRSDAGRLKPAGPAFWPFDRNALAALQRGDAVMVLGHDAAGAERCLLAADASCIRAEAANLMATQGRGVISCAVGADEVLRFGLTLVPRKGAGSSPAFLGSVEAREGVGSGISAADRARTLRTLGSRRAGVADLVSPGHIMPNYVSDVAGWDGAMPDAVLPLLRAAAGCLAAAWCDVLDDDGDVASHAQGRALARIGSIPLLCDRAAA